MRKHVINFSRENKVIFRKAKNSVGPDFNTDLIKKDMHYRVMALGFSYFSNFVYKNDGLEISFKVEIPAYLHVINNKPGLLKLKV